MKKAKKINKQSINKQIPDPENTLLDPVFVSATTLIIWRMMDIKNDDLRQRILKEGHLKNKLKFISTHTVIRLNQNERVAFYSWWQCKYNSTTSKVYTGFFAVKNMSCWELGILFTHVGSYMAIQWLCEPTEITRLPHFLGGPVQFAVERYAALFMKVR